MELMIALFFFSIPKSALILKIRWSVLPRLFVHLEEVPSLWKVSPLLPKVWHPLATNCVMNIPVPMVSNAGLLSIIRTRAFIAGKIAQDTRALCREISLQRRILLLWLAHLFLLLIPH